MAWNYVQPVKIQFGVDCISELKNLAKELHGTKGLLVTSSHFIKDKTAEKIMAESDGIFTTVFGEVSPNPDVAQVDACARLVREKNIDFLAALGGGSVIDCAKAVSVIALTNDSVQKYHGTGIPVPAEHLPLIAVPTTAGTGSEVTNVSVLTDRKNGKKMPVVSDSFYPSYAVIDPKVTYSMPPHVTAETGIDALCHAIEGYWSRGHLPICDMYALRAAEIVFNYLLKAYEEPQNETAREKMCEASLFAGLAFNLPKTTACHACSFPLTNLYHIPHGETCGLTLDYFTRINAKGKKGYRIQTFARKLGFEDADEMADAIHELKEKTGLRNDLKDLHLSEEKIAELVKISRHPNLFNNPVEITDEMLFEMYHVLG